MTAGLGDTLFDSVAVRALAETWPGIRIEAVVHHRRPDIARHNPFISRIHLLRKGPLGFLCLYTRLACRGRWDAILLLSCLDPEARCLGYLLNKDATLGYGWRTQMTGIAAHEIDSKELRQAHFVDQSLALAEVAGARTTNARMVYEVSAEDRQKMATFLTQRGITLRGGVVFQLGGGGGPHRDWPVEHFAALMKMAHDAGIGPLFALGGPDHRVKAEHLAELLGPVPYHDLVGKLPLSASVALIEQADCLVSTDTGIMHLGFAMGTPTIALIHCSPGARRVGPSADLERHEVIELPKPPGYKKKEDARMRDLQPETVFERLNGLHGKAAPAA